MRYILAVIGVVLLAIVAIVFLLRLIPNNSGTANPQSRAGTVLVTNYNTPTSSMVQTTHGALVAEENRRSIRITVSQSQRKIEVLNGYNEVPSKTETLTNNASAYNAFLHGIQNAGFTRKRLTTQTDETGTCPLGNRYNYDLLNNGNSLSSLWNSSCAQVDGTFNGNGPLIRQLFQAQIPDYSQFVSGVNLF